MKKFISLGNIVVFPKCGQNIESCTPLTEQQLLMNLSSAKKLYTELAGVGHNAWDYAFVDSMMFKWVFLQSKAQPTAVSPRHITNYQLTKYTDREILSFHPVKTELSYMITGKTIKATGKFGTGIYITKPVQR